MVLAFYSNNPSLNPVEVDSFSVILYLKRTKINKKEAGVGSIYIRVCSTDGIDRILVNNQIGITRFLTS